MSIGHKHSYNSPGYRTYNKIYITPVETGFRHRRWKLEISINGRKYMSPEAYGPTDVWEKMYEYYNYYYKKYER